MLRWKMLRSSVRCCSLVVVQIRDAVVQKGDPEVQCEMLKSLFYKDDDSDDLKNVDEAAVRLNKKK